MVNYRRLEETQDDFSSAMARHSGDETRVYKTVGDEKLRISLYYPQDYDPARRYPLLVCVHGGGWASRKVFPDQEEWAGDYLGFLARRYAERGCLCASIDYRLMRGDGKTPGYELIDLYEDCADAADYLRAHADELGIDRQRTAVLGESAGGYLAAALVTLPIRDHSFFKTAILANPITDLFDPRWGARVADESAHPVLSALSGPEKRALLSPVCHITEETCPTLLLHGACDGVVFPFHALKYHDLLAACGREARLELIENTGHAFMLAEYVLEGGRSLSALECGVRAIDEWLAARGF